MKDKIKNFMIKHSRTCTMLVGVVFVTRACIIFGYYEPEIDTELLED